MVIFRPWVSTLLLVWLSVGGAALRAQVVGPGYVPPTGARARATAGRAGYVGTAPVYGGYSPYVYNQSRIEGYMNGVANVTNANAQYQQTIQEAKITQSQAQQAQLQTRRAAIEQWQYEQQFLPNSEKMRLKAQEDAVKRAMNFPPSTEIWSGQALNALLRDIQQSQYHQVFGPPVPVRSDVLQHINLTDGTTRGSVGTLKSDKLSWPLYLQGTEWQEQRTKVEDLFADATRQATSSGMVAAGVINDLRAELRSMANKVDDNIAKITPDEWVGSKRYISQLQDTVQTLQSAQVQNYFGKWEAKGPTVRDLVLQLTQEGLTFAPATEGDRSFYTVLHSAMVTYNTGIKQILASAAPPMGE